MSSANQPFAPDVLFDTIAGGTSCQLLNANTATFSPAVTPEPKVKLSEPMEAKLKMDIIGFDVTSDSAADNILKAVKTEEAERDRLVSLAETKKAELDALIKFYRDRCEQRTKYLKEALRRYFDTVERRETKTMEKYELLSGTLVLRKPSEKMKVSNEAQLVDWLEISGKSELVKVDKKPKWGELKRRLCCDSGHVVDSYTGEVVNGVEIEQTPEKFDVK